LFLDPCSISPESAAMRVVIGLAVFAFAAVGAASAFGADLAVGTRGVVGGGYARIVEPALPIVIYDDEPGTVLRAYWRAPWRHRHYFPSNGKAPRLGRLENLTVRGPRPKPAQTFYREWSTAPHDALLRARGEASDPIPAAPPSNFPQSRHE
jgi:hypothetical protein